MFSKRAVNIASIVAIILSVLAIAISCFGVYVTDSGLPFRFVLGCISWGMLLWASIIGYQITSKYNLYEDEYKKVGYRIYAIIVAFVLFLTIGLIGGILISLYILGTIRGLKQNYDQWADQYGIESIGKDEHGVDTIGEEESA